MEMGLYDRIQKLCEDRKISIARLESDCGLSNSTIKKWKATSTPGVDKIKEIAQYFRVTVYYLLDITEFPTFSTLISFCLIAFIDYNASGFSLSSIVIKKFINSLKQTFSYNKRGPPAPFLVNLLKSKP